VSTRDYLEKDYYATLGVPKDAGAAEIKKAYRKLARENHPDANTGDPKAEERFKDISAAYDVLADPKRRKDYDEARTLFGNGPAGFRMPGGGGPGGFTFDLGDLFGQAGSGAGGAGGAAGAAGLGDLLGGMFARNRAGTTTAGPSPRRGADVESEVLLDFAEAVDGATVPLRMTGVEPCRVCAGTGAKAGTTPRMCPTCLGTGQTSRNAGGFAFAEPCRECRGRGLVVDDPCPACSGSGRARTAHTLNVRIPAGVQDGQRIRLKGKGAAGERGGPPGDLYVVVRVKAHPLFGRQGDNLTVTVPITFPEAALGGEVSVPTLNGSPVTVRLAPGTASGRTLRVRGRGAARKDGTRGDLLVTVEVAVPQRLDAPATEALNAYRRATGDHDPRADLTAGDASGPAKGG